MKKKQEPPVIPILPPQIGWIDNLFDALLIFEAASRGVIPRVTRRLTEQERTLVTSGAIFVFDEAESGMKRWTDGLIWSPSRMLGNFLIYRQCERRHGRLTPDIEEQSEDDESGDQEGEDGKKKRQDDSQETEARDVKKALKNNRLLEISLLGSLTNSYKFKPGGLIKKAITLGLRGGFTQHVISYYTLEDVIAGRLRKISSLPEMLYLDISPMYLNPLLFKEKCAPQTDVDAAGKLFYVGEPTPEDHSKTGSRRSRKASKPGTGNTAYDSDGYLLPDSSDQADQEEDTGLVAHSNAPSGEGGSPSAIRHKRIGYPYEPYNKNDQGRRSAANGERSLRPRDVQAQYLPPHHLGQSVSNRALYPYPPMPMIGYGPMPGHAYGPYPPYGYPYGPPPMDPRYAYPGMDPHMRVPPMMYHPYGPGLEGAPQSSMDPALADRRQPDDDEQEKEGTE